MEIEPKVTFEDTSVAFSYKNISELKRANFVFSIVNNPFGSAVAIGLVKVALFLRLPVKGLIKKTVFFHFCGGETIEQSDQTILKLSDHSVNTILDYSVEGAHTEAGFDQTLEEILRTFDKAKSNSHIPFCVFKITGMASIDLLAKVQQNEKLTDAEEIAFARVKARVDKICSKAHAYSVPVLIDAEDSWIQRPLDEMVTEMMQKYNTETAIVFNTYQMYRVEMLRNLKDAFHHATMHNYFLGAKLVRGAYMEKERERAEKMKYNDPILPTKEATDENFNAALQFCIDNKQRVSVMCGSHNEYSNKFLAVLLEKHSMQKNDKRVWFAQLLGMSDNISFNLAKQGYNVCKYVPYGPVEAVMPYLFRRAEENTSVAGQSSRELSLIRKELKRRKVERTS
ncbi:MAG: proline dehydrogenase [Flammeovirgaceae bacterium]|nr:proline dehydrogenase [Flammeovirgaceae bacterium]